jgi:hypothetical protein
MIERDSLPTVVIGPFVSEGYAEGLVQLISQVGRVEVVRVAELDQIVAVLDEHDGEEHKSIVVLDADNSVSRGGELDRLPAASVVVLLDSRGAHAEISVDNPSGDWFVQIVRALLWDRDGRATAVDPSDLFDTGGANWAEPIEPLDMRPVEEWLNLTLGLALSKLRIEQSGRSITGWYVSPDSALAALGFTEETDLADLEGRLKNADRSLIEDGQTLPTVLTAIVDRLDLAAEELRAVLLTMAPDLDGRYGMAFGVLNDDLTRRRPNLTTLVRLLDTDGGRSAWSLQTDPSGVKSVFDSGLIAYSRSGEAQAEADAALVASSAVLHHVILGPVSAAARMGAELHRPRNERLTEVETQTVQRLEALRPTGRRQTVIINPAGTEAGWFQRLVTAGGRSLLVGDVTAIESAYLTTTVNDWFLLAQLEQAAVLVLGLDRLGPQDQARFGHILTRNAARLPLLAIVGDRINDSLGFAPVVKLRAPTVTARERTVLWREACEAAGLSLSEDDARHLAATLPLSPGEMATCISLADRADAAGSVDADDLRSLVNGDSPLRRRLQTSARRLNRVLLPPAVKQIDTTFGWDDIVLTPAVLERLQMIAAHLAHAGQVMEEWGFESRVPYGNGLAALFSGSSGTGKTMAAQIIAGELGVELLQVDLAETVSKYIGETEKNLDAAFEAAERLGAVLLFDEADALFGKRTEVKDSHDRHANVEVAYLLQRIEAFRGLAILTTNLKQNIDNAFLRRLRFSIDFPAPTAVEREQIWRRSFPGNAPLADELDLSFLARRLKLTGGSIQQIALHAAFAAAGEKRPIGPDHVVAAARQELVKVGMLNTEKALEESAA